MYEDYSDEEIKGMISDIQLHIGKLKSPERIFIHCLEYRVKHNIKIDGNERDLLIKMHNGIAENTYD